VAHTEAHPAKPTRAGQQRQATHRASTPACIDRRGWYTKGLTRHPVCWHEAEGHQLRLAARLKGIVAAGPSAGGRWQQQMSVSRQRQGASTAWPAGSRPPPPPSALPSLRRPPPPTRQCWGASQPRWLHAGGLGGRGWEGCPEGHCCDAGRCLRCMQECQRVDLLLRQCRQQISCFC
jgi:hypothetical protein